jgi:uncharacterized membrane protein
MLVVASNAVPEGGTGSVLAAYLVFLALILIYVVITAIRLSRLQRELEDVTELAERRVATADPLDEAKVPTR